MSKARNKVREAKLKTGEEEEGRRGEKKKKKRVLGVTTNSEWKMLRGRRFMMPSAAGRTCNL